jgi:hypothetical protein
MGISCYLSLPDQMRFREMPGTPERQEYKTQPGEWLAYCNELKNSVWVISTARHKTVIAGDARVAGDRVVETAGCGLKTLR